MEGSMTKSLYKFKEGIEHGDIHMITRKMHMVLSYVLVWAEKNGKEIVITNVLQKFPQSKSNTHPEGRAIDIRTLGWRLDEIMSLINFLETHVGDYGAISSETGEPRVAYFHDAGLGQHIHLQVSRG